MEENNIELGIKKEDIKKKNDITIVIVVLLTIALIVGLTVGLTVKDSPKEKFKIENVTMDVEHIELLNYYTVYINGTLKNLTDKHYDYVSVEYAIYDSAGNNLGTAMDNVNNIGAGDTWKFRAMLLDNPNSRPATFKLIKITEW